MLKCRVLSSCGLMLLPVMTHITSCVFLLLLLLLLFVSKSITITITITL